MNQANHHSISGNQMKWLLLAILSLVWGSSFILMKRGLEVFAADQVAAYRMALASLAILPFIYNKIHTIPREKIKYIIVVGVFGSGIPALLFATAQTRINSSLAGMLNGLTPVFTMIIGSFFFNTMYTHRQILGVIIGFIGAAFLVLLRAEGGISNDSEYAFLIVLATVCYGVSVNTIKAHLHEINSVLIAGTGLLFAGIPYGIYLLSGDFCERLILPNAMTSLSCISILSLFGTALSSILYFHLVKISSPLFASVVTYFIPIVALFWGFYDNEVFNPLHLLAMGAILGGVLLLSKVEIRKRSK